VTIALAPLMSMGKDDRPRSSLTPW
jgi:hypothetical protein